MWRSMIVAVPVAATLLLSGCSTAPANSRTSGAASPDPTGSATATVTLDDPIVTIGDSIMLGNGLDPDQAWPALIAAQSGAQLTNLSCDGAGFLAIGNYQECGDTFSTLVAQAIELHPATVIVEGSSNDLGEDSDELLAETLKQVSALRAALPDARIIGLSSIWNDQARVPAQLAEIDDEVKEAVTGVGGTFVSIGQPLQGHPEWMQDDDVHPTADGQVAIAAAVTAALAAVGLSFS